MVLEGKIRKKRLDLFYHQHIHTLTHQHINTSTH